MFFNVLISTSLSGLWIAQQEGHLWWNVIGLHWALTMRDWFSWKILHSCLNGSVGGGGRYYVFCSGRQGGGEVRGFDILSLISCFSAAWRLTLMHWKDVVLTAHQHIHVRSPLGSRIFRPENNPFWKDEVEVGVFSCSSHKWFWEEKWSHGQKDRKWQWNRRRKGGGKTAWAWDFFTVKDYTFRKKSLNVGNKNNT